jgi:hypothetical protein
LKLANDGLAHGLLDAYANSSWLELGVGVINSANSPANSTIANSQKVKKWNKNEVAALLYPNRC